MLGECDFSLNNGICWQSFWVHRVRTTLSKLKTKIKFMNDITHS